jgi:hypothetical protein
MPPLPKPKWIAVETSGADADVSFVGTDAEAFDLDPEAPFERLYTEAQVRELLERPTGEQTSKVEGDSDMRILASHLTGIAKHLRACPAYHKLLGDAEYIERASETLRNLAKPNQPEGLAAAPSQEVEITDDMVERFAESYFPRGATYTPQFIRDALTAALAPAREKARE